MTVRARRPRMLLALFAAIVPGRVARFVHVRLLGHRIDPSAHIGHSFVDVDRLVMGPRATIGHLNAIRGCEDVEMDEDALVGHLVFVNAVRKDKDFFPGIDRHPALIMGPAARIMMMHFVDASDRVQLDERATIAGYWTLVMTHTFDHRENRQATHPIHIGTRTWIGTRTTLLPGAVLGERSLVAAGSVVTGKLEENGKLYAGTPAKPIRDLDTDTAFFRRTETILR